MLHNNKLPLGELIEKLINWMTINFAGFFDAVKNGLDSIINNITWLLAAIPVPVFIIGAVVIAWWVAGRSIAIFAGLGLSLIYNLGLWKQTVQTLSLVSTSAMLAVIIGLPLGISMAKSNRLNSIARPVLDFMQTMPAFVYLIPAVYFFDLGAVPGAVATVIFAMPPIVRLTNLGIRQVPPDIVEASRAFGATPVQLLFKVQLPLATPTILAGLNQTIMLSLSMVVISAMIGADGLGNVVLQGITQMKIAQGFEGGLAVVILAMILDRVTQCLGAAPKTSGRCIMKNIRRKHSIHK